MRILLDKAVGYFADTAVKAIRGIKLAPIAVTKMLSKRGGERQFCAAETIDRLPIISDSKQVRA